MILKIGLPVEWVDENGGTRGEGTGTSQSASLRPTPCCFQPADPNMLEITAHGMSVVIDNHAGPVGNVKLSYIVGDGRQAARLGWLPGSGNRASTMEREAAETLCPCNYRALTHNKQPINTSLSFLRSQSCNCLGGSCCKHHVFFMTAVSSLRDVKQVALRAKQQPHHLPRSPWEPSIVTYGRSIIIAGSTQARQHVQQKSPSRKCS